MEIDRFQQMVWYDLSQRQTGANASGCLHCGGLGILTVSVSLEHPAHGRAFKCICQRNEILRRNLDAVIKGAGDTIPEDIHKFTIEDDEPWGHAQLALDYARQLVEGEITDKDGVTKGGLLLVGPTGTGKTTLASLVFRARGERGEAVAWCDYLRLIKRIQGTYKQNYAGASEEEIIDAVSSAPFLVFDDLGAGLRDELASVNRVEIVFQIIHYRNAHKLPTLITSNLTPEHIRAQFDERLSSRVIGMCHGAIMRTRDFRLGEVG